MALTVEGTDDDTFPVRDVDLVLNGDPEVSYTIRRLPVPKVRAMYEAHKRRNRNGEIDPLAIADDQLDFILVDWVGIVGKGGAPLPCDRDAKLGNLEKGLRGLPTDRRVALLRLAQEAERTAEAAKRDSL